MRKLWILGLLGAFVLMGCSRGEKQAKEEPPKTPDVAAQSSAPPAVQNPSPVQQAPEAPAPDQQQGPQGSVERHHERRSTPKQEQAPPPGPSAQLMTLPVGSTMSVALSQTISTETAKTGTPFTATTTDPVLLNGVQVIPAGATVNGDVGFAKRAGRLGGSAEMTLEFKNLTTPDGKTYDLTAKTLDLQGKGTGKGDIEKVAGGTIGGAILGGILGGKKGALEGAAAGGVGGGVWAVATRGNDIVLDPAQKMQVTLTRDLRIPVMVPAGQHNP